MDLLNKNQYPAKSKSLSKIFYEAFYIASSSVSLDGKKCQILLLPHHRMVHISRKIREAEKMQHFLHLYDKSTKRNITIKFARAGLFSCHLSKTLTQLLSDFIKHAVDHFASFLTPFLLVSTILCFQATAFVDFLIYKKIAVEKLWKKHDPPP